MGRRILHIDMDAFFASVEQALHPEYQGKPLVVVTKVDSPRGVVSSASYEARAYGISAGMPINEARRQCPQGIFIPGDYERYVRVSDQVVSILYRFSPELIVASIDESFLDITKTVKFFGTEDSLARKLKDALRRELGLPCTVGIASSYVVAKIAVKQAKPDGYLNIPSGREVEFLASLPVRHLPGVGPKLESIFHNAGVYTIGQLHRFTLEELQTWLGRACGLHIYFLAQGKDVELFPRLDIPRVISRETTFDKDLLRWRTIYPHIVTLLEACTYELRQKQCKARRLTLKVRYSDFETLTFSHSFPQATLCDTDFLSALVELIHKAQQRQYQVRLIGVALSDITPDTQQLELFCPKVEEKRLELVKCMDRIRTRYGFSLIHWCSALSP